MGDSNVGREFLRTFEHLKRSIDFPALVADANQLGHSFAAKLADQTKPRFKEAKMILSRFDGRNENDILLFAKVVLTQNIDILFCGKGTRAGRPRVAIKRNNRGVRDTLSCQTLPNVDQIASGPLG